MGENLYWMPHIIPCWVNIQSELGRLTHVEAIKLTTTIAPKPIVYKAPFLNECERVVFM